MIKLLKAEWLREKRNKSIIILNSIIIAVVLALYLWVTYGTNSQIAQKPLKTAGNAGVYALVIFTTICRKIWAVLYGFMIMKMELIENRSDFFVQNTSRIKFLGSKMIFGSITAAAMILAIYTVPMLISAFVSHGIDLVLAVPTLITTFLVIWIITIGNILLGMLFSLIIKDTIIVAAIVLTLEYFTNIYPEFILKVWEKVDGYWYVSNLLVPVKRQLSNLNNFMFLTSDAYTGYCGFLLWIPILALMIMISFCIFCKKDF